MAFVSLPRCAEILIENRKSCTRPLFNGPIEGDSVEILQRRSVLRKLEYGPILSGEKSWRYVQSVPQNTSA